MMKSKRKTLPGGAGKWLEAISFRGTDSPVVVERPAIQYDIGKHMHDFMELILILDGFGLHDFQNESYKLKAGDCFLVESGISHAYRSTKELKIVNVLIRSSFVEKFGPMLMEHPAYSSLLGKFRNGKRSPLQRPSLSQEELDACMRVVDEIERERREMKSGHTTMMTGLLLELFVMIFRFLQRAGAHKDDRRSPWLSKILDHLEIHFAEDIPMRHLQKMAGMSERSFQRHFLEMTGLTPLRYILRLRIARACRLLREENKSVYEVASVCGFENCSYFCRLFKSITGHSPSKYANQQVG
ncbi:MAG: helix-turn-helix domain-containing protein [Victivallales bacterium]